MCVQRYGRNNIMSLSYHIQIEVKHEYDHDDVINFMMHWKEEIQEEGFEKVDFTYIHFCYIV